MQSSAPAEADLPVVLIYRNRVKPSREKYLACAVGQITGFSSRRPAPDTRGASRSSRNVVRDAMDAMVSRDE
jgi:hypothetical protein